MAATLTSTFHAAARRFGDRVAVQHAQGSVRYAELAERVERLAGWLQETGRAERRLGVLLPNLATFPLVFFAVQRARGSAVLLNPLNSARETEEVVRDARVAEVLTVEPLLGLVPPELDAVLVDELPAAVRVRRGGEERAHALDAAPPVEGAEPAADDEAVVIHTAAYDGWLRGAALTHRNLVANLRGTVEAMELREDGRVVAALPFVHAFGLTVCLTAPLAAGARVLPVERFHPLRVLDLFAEQRATHFAGVPAMFLSLLSAAERREPLQHALRVTLCGGAPLALELAGQWEARFGLPLRQGYGLTEASPVCLFNRVDRPNHPGTLGYAYPGVEVSIRDAAGTELPRGEVGEICVRGPNVFGGYLGQPGRSARDFHGEWLRTGDLGSMDAEGVVTFRGILKPMFTRNGFNVYPHEIQRVLEEDPRIAAATACALPDPQRENEIVLLLRPAPGASITEEEVRELCRHRLAAYKQPVRVELVDAPA